MASWRSGLVRLPVTEETAGTIVFKRLLQFMRQVKKYSTKNQFAYVPPVRTVVIAGLDSPARYGLARMFETLDKAMPWLGEAETPDSSEPPVTVLVSAIGRP